MVGWRRMMVWAVWLAWISAMPSRAADTVAANTVAERLAAACHEAVVGVYCMRDDYEGYMGTGAVVSADGYILTSTTSVFDGVEEVFVHFPDFRVMKAKVVEINMPLECVLLKVDAKDLASLPVSRAIPRVGSRAFTAGNADHLIRLSGEPTFSMGTVSGVYDVQSGDSQSSYAGLAIETTAAVNPGQDGGPLLDASGRIIGMISLSMSESRWQGTAVPMARILEGMQAFRDGRVRVSDRPLLDEASPDDGRKSMADRVQPWADCLVGLNVEREFQVERLATVYWPIYRKTIPNWEALTPAAQVARQADVTAAEMTINANRLVCRPRKVVTGPIDDMVITVKMADGTVRSAEVLGRSPAYDVALLQLQDTSNLTPLALADSSALQVGDRVVAIGNALALGDEPTVSTGIISALGRSLEVTAGVTLHDLIQTDAAINYGNSGGALVNNRGELVGINSAGIPNAQNVGFAISVGTVQPLLERLKAGEQIDAAPIGFIGITLNETPDGLRILDVGDDTPADAAGLQPDDMLRSVAGTPVATSEQLGSVLRRLGPGAAVEVVVERDGSDVTVTMTLAERPAD